MKKSKYRMLKFDGDDSYSFAIFYAKDVCGLRSPIQYGQAIPIICGMAYREACQKRKTMDKQNT